MNFGDKPTVPPLKLHEGFEDGLPRRIRIDDGGRKDSIRIVQENPAAGANCLKITDGPDLVPAFNPHLYLQPAHRSGTTRVSFDVKVEPAMHWIHEWRNDAQPYRTGPMITIADGKLSVPGRELLAVPPNVWMHLEVSTHLGDESDGTWRLVVTLPGSAPQRFDGLRFVNAEMKTLDWLGFISAGTSAASWWLDELEIE